MKINHKENPIPHRRNSYPDIGEQLDAIYKGFMYLKKRGTKFPPETMAWLDQVTQIKDTFKKD